MSVHVTRLSMAPVAPRCLHDLIATRAHCEERLGWPVTLEVKSRRLVVTVGEMLDAVTMPTLLGQKVLAELQITMLAGPVIAAAGGAWWTFLTAPAAVSRQGIPAELRARKVHLTPDGAQVIIPNQIDSEATPRWVVSPRPLPPWSAVIGATRRVADQLASADCH